MDKSISFLLGAGFSVPIGYPIGAELNELLLSYTGNDFAFCTEGVLIPSTDGKRPDFGFRNSDDDACDFCSDLIRHFTKSKGKFDYEEFYDYLNNDASKDKEVEDLLKVDVYGNKKNLWYMLNQLQRIYPQLVDHFLVDRYGRSWYENAMHLFEPRSIGYNGILDFIQKFCKDNIFNVHSLNHDLFFEHLIVSDGLREKFCDGFEELGSPYYGNIRTPEGGLFKCRLQYYDGKYDKEIRLFKLHGSKDYSRYFRSDGSEFTLENYVKIRFGTGLKKLFKEIKDEDGKLIYEECWKNYHAEILTGITSKIARYKDPLLFGKLFDNFKKNLEVADKLIIIGYGGKDQEINKMILKHFDFENKPSYIIDPFPSAEIEFLMGKLGASMIEKSLQEVEMEDII